MNERKRRIDSDHFCDTWSFFFSKYFAQRNIRNDILQKTIPPSLNPKSCEKSILFPLFPSGYKKTRGVKGLIFERTRRLDKRTRENCEKIWIFLVICDSRVELQLKEGGARLGSISVPRRGGQLHFQPQRRLLININTQAPSLSVCREFIVPATRQPLCKYWRMVDFMGGLWFRERGWKGGSLLVYTRKICRFFLSFSIKRLKCECFRIFSPFSVKSDKVPSFKRSLYQ